MKLRKLDNSFYIENSHLKEALDNHGGHWEEGKVRGYGIVIISINNLSFAIPLRSNIKHNSSYITAKDNKNGAKGKGLDFTKALLITKQKYVSNLPFKIQPHEHQQLAGKEHYITQKFKKYISKYISAVQGADNNILRGINYRFSTLCNYHQELGLK